ncbi:hypothetical protein SRM1_02238 [Pseudomonas fluorescens]|nr:hypothetical protein SRM1_02238 [Pseudomonas fluorescens]
MFGQVRQFTIQSIMATRPQPLRRILAVAVLRAEVEFDRQFQVMHAVAITQQHVQLAKGVPLAADRQIGRDQLNAWRVLHGKLPQSLVVQTQAPRACLGQPVLQTAAVVIELTQPLLQSPRIADPVAARQRMALRPRRGREHRRGEDHPRQIAHVRMT